MSEHAVQEAPGHAGSGHDDHSPAAAAEALRFEKSELEYFVEEDQYCGAAIGKLLAATFCVLLFLMTGVAIWTQRHQSVSHDPHDVPTAETAPAH